ncbi:DHS-like NAD/FAD-binding domain-containing protein [Pluteus cervinus]|uniref:DHS-like NAD/FAD-binding domain-containing protein n=1 Tax=Pluteus cervinus TaxID=181527 RepID=A0ACD3AT52_9AGAR|nr:DHS-like NAD/FAD-binding domain-containing protein [Pluteus cervinus]
MLRTIDLEQAHAEDSALRDELRRISLALANSKKVVVITGAGISCSSGIPDFRTAGGIFTKKKRFGVKAQDVFSANVFQTTQGQQAFNQVMGELKEAIDQAQPTSAHQFVKQLYSKGTLLRSYSQNIDGLEELAGIPEALTGNGRDINPDGKNVQLHGTIHKLKCFTCFVESEWTEDFLSTFKSGQAPKCPACEKDQDPNRRRRNIGSLRPAIVMYDEDHPFGDDIARLQNHDKECQPDFLIVMGTSLSIPGLVKVVNFFAEDLQEDSILYVNKTTASATLSKPFGYHIHGEADLWVNMVFDDWGHTTTPTPPKTPAGSQLQGLDDEDPVYMIQLEACNQFLFLSLPVLISSIPFHAEPTKAAVEVSCNQCPRIRNPPMANG